MDLPSWGWSIRPRRLSLPPLGVGGAFGWRNTKEGKSRSSADGRSLQNSHGELKIKLYGAHMDEIIESLMAQNLWPFKYHYTEDKIITAPKIEEPIEEAPF